MSQVLGHLQTYSPKSPKFDKKTPSITTSFFLRQDTFSYWFWGLAFTSNLQQKTKGEYSSCLVCAHGRGGTWLVGCFSEQLKKSWSWILTKLGGLGKSRPLISKIISRTLSRDPIQRYSSFFWPKIKNWPPERILAKNARKAPTGWSTWPLLRINAY